MIFLTALNITFVFIGIYLMIEGSNEGKFSSVLSGLAVTSVNVMAVLLQLKAGIL